MTTLSSSPATTDQDRAAVETVVRQSGTSFFWGMRRLPAARRRAVYAVYAFCREVDDIADGPDDEDIKRARLAKWREEIANALAGRGKTAIGRELATATTAFDLDPSDFNAVIAGMEMDAPSRVRIADMAELELYCDRVACAVGRLCVRIFGFPDDAGDELAAAQGMGLQLTNILRDLREDAVRDRLYLPRDLLSAAGITGDACNDVLARAELSVVCRQLAEIARENINTAEVLLADADPRVARPAAMMLAVYRRIFAKIEARGWDRPLDPVSLGKVEKIWLAFRYGVLG